MNARHERVLEGQVAVVTGGGKGIGRAIALGLGARGVRVVVSGREERALGEVVGELTHAGGAARHVVGDVADAAHVESVVARAVTDFGRLDIVVANAGQSGRVPLGVDLARAEAILRTNLLGTYHVFHAAAPHMKGPGRLIAMSSVLGKFGVPGYAAYCASKAGLHGLVRAAALELKDRQITCNAVCPGWVDTAMAQEGLNEIAAGTKKSARDVRRAAEAEVPLGRFLEPGEIAEFVVFLCTSAADGITGQAISMCGGSTAFGS